jgi:hypothetical protein
MERRSSTHDDNTSLAVRDVGATLMSVKPSTISGHATRARTTGTHPSRIKLFSSLDVSTA